MNRRRRIVTACLTLGISTLTSGYRSHAQTPTGPAPGAPGSGLLTGGAALRQNDVVEALRLYIGLDAATPAQIAAADIDMNGTIDLGDLVTMLRASVNIQPLPARPAPTAAAPLMSFTAQTGWYDAHSVTFITTDSSDAAMATEMKVNFAPALAAAKDTDGVRPLYHFFTQQNGAMTPVAGQLPVFGSAPLETNYSPLWRISNVIVTPAYKANALTRDDDITHDPGTGKGGSVVSIQQTDAVVDCPILFDPEAGPNGMAYVTPVAAFSIDSKTVSLPTEVVIYDGDPFLMVVPDSSDPMDAAAHHVNFAPGMAGAAKAAIPFYLILGASGSAAQPPVLSAIPKPIGPTSQATDYTPAWMLQKVQWSASVAAPPMLKSDDEVKAHLASGDLKSVPGTFVFNCPVVATGPGGGGTMTPPPPPAPVSIAVTDFAFGPKDMTVPVGTTVTWTNSGKFAHTTTSGANGAPDGLWESGTLQPGKTFSFTFSKAGIYPYYCRFHVSMGMAGSVTVK